MCSSSEIRRTSGDDWQSKLINRWIFDGFSFIDRRFSWVMMFLVVIISKISNNSALTLVKIELNNHRSSREVFLELRSFIDEWWSGNGCRTDCCGSWRFVINEIDKEKRIDLRTGRNSIIVILGANLLLNEDDLNKAEDIIRRSKVLVCQLEIRSETVVAALKLARKYSGKCRTFLLYFDRFFFQFFRFSIRRQCPKNSIDNFYL